MRQHKKGERISMQGGVGLGDEVISFHSAQFDYEPEVWRLFSFYYDGQGTGMFFLNGKVIGKKTFEGKGPSAPGLRDIGFGERTGSTFAGLPGYVAQARLVKGISNRLNYLGLTLEHPYKRTAFERMEKGQKLKFKIDYLLGGKIPDLNISYFDGLSEKIFKFTANDDSSSAELELPLPCHGKVAAYIYKVHASGQREDGVKFESTVSFDYHICARLPEFMPIVLWDSSKLDNIKNTGFTHSLVWMDHLDKAAWDKAEPLPYNHSFDSTKETLNKMMVMGLRALAKMSPSSYFSGQPEYAEIKKDYLCLNRDGTKNRRVNFSLPRLQEHSFNAARSMANSLHMYPQVDMILNDSEFRDNTQLSFRPEDKEAFTKATGMKDIHEKILVKDGVKYSTIKDFPASRIIPENDPILTYYRWFWAGADGVPGILSQAWRGFQYSDNVHWKVLWDPVVRCPSKWGSGGDVDIISQWTYTYPDPLVMGMATDEVLAMLKGGPAHQNAGKMTQVIWYRSQTAGKLSEDKNKWAEWEKNTPPEAQFITIPPDFSEIALWQKISRPISSILYHGSGSLFDHGNKTGYVFTNGETAKRLEKLFKGVVKPLGATLLKVPDKEAEIAILESFASQMFYGDISFGNMNNPASRVHAALVRAHYQPEIIYDETILAFGLDKFKVLVMPSCAVLSEAVAERIMAWQKSGGVIVADDLLAPGITPDVLFQRIMNSDKELSVTVGNLLRKEINSVLQPYAEADSSDAILRVRSYGSSDYLFAFNDNRTYGDYLGQYRKVMEKGVELKSKIKVNRQSAAVYNLVENRKIDSQVIDGSTYFNAEFGPGEGFLYLITEKTIADLKVAVQRSVKRGASTAIEITVLDSSRKAINAVIPLEVRGLDSNGHDMEINGYYAAVGGKIVIPADIAVNDSIGKWELSVRDLASGNLKTISFVVK